MTWKKDDGASNYIIFRSDSKNGTYKKIGKTTKTKYTDKKVKSGKTYYYAVGIDLKENSLNKSKIKGDIKSVKIP